MIITTIIGTDDLTLEEVKHHLNITFNDDDNMIEALKKTSLNAVENYCRSYFLERELHQSILGLSDILPAYIVSDLTQDPNHDTVEVEYIDQTGVQTILVNKLNLYNQDQNHYKYIDKRIEITLVDTIPIVDGSTAIIKWKLGQNEIEDSIDHARLLLCGTYYENREDAVTGVSVNDLPNGVKFLLEPYMNLQIG